VQVEDVLHPAHERRVLARRDAPLLLLPRLERVFLRTRRTVSSETASTTSSSTSRPARSFSVQQGLPSGGAEQARATSRASAAPSSLRKREGRSWGLRCSAAARPRSTKRWRERATV